MVGRFEWSDGTIWLDVATAKNSKQAVSNAGAIHNVPESVWTFRVGGYQVCDKWLKDRKGVRLSRKEIDCYQKIIGALAKLPALMGEVDAIIEEKGGWPSAFLVAAGNTGPSLEI